MSGDTLLMIGGSGAMGQHVIRSLLRSESRFDKIRIFTRNPSGNECRALMAMGSGRVELARGNVNDEQSLRSALHGSDAVFCNTNFWSCLQDVWVESGSSVSDPWPLYKMAEDLDVEQGKQILELARLAGVKHLVLSSLDAMASPSNGLFPAPHFDAKARVDHFIDQQRPASDWYVNCVTSLVTAPYMENFVAGRMFRGGGTNAAVQLLDANGTKRLLIKIPLGSAPWPMVTLDDIGWFSTLILNNRDAWTGKTLKIVSQSLPMNEIAKIFERVTGIKATYEPFSLSEYRSVPLPERPALANMFGFIGRFGLTRDLKALRALKPELDTFESWLRRSGWKGEVGVVQKDNSQPIK